MSASNDPKVSPAPGGGGLLQTLRAGINAGGLCGLVFGLVDGVLASFEALSKLSLLELVGCIAASVVPSCSWRSCSRSGCWRTRC